MIRPIIWLLIIIILLVVTFCILVVIVHDREPIRITYNGEPNYMGENGDIVLTYDTTYLPLLIREPNWDFNNKGKPLHIRNTDVLYRSSNCIGSRDRLARIIKSHLEKDGFTFKASGKCGRTHVPDIEFGNVGAWFECPECEDAKCIIAFENFGNRPYLTEKPFLAMQYGAIPLYWGNGQKFLNKLGVNTERIIDRSYYETDESFAEDVVNLLKNKQRLEQMYNMTLFHESDGLTASKIYKPFINSLRQAGCNTKRINKLKDNKVVCIDITAENIVDPEYWMRDALCLDSDVELQYVNRPGIDTNNPRCTIPDVVATSVA